MFYNMSISSICSGRCPWPRMGWGRSRRRTVLRRGHQPWGASYLLNAVENTLVSSEMHFFADRNWTGVGMTRFTGTSGARSLSSFKSPLLQNQGTSAEKLFILVWKSVRTNSQHFMKKYFTANVNFQTLVRHDGNCPRVRPSPPDLSPRVCRTLKVMVLSPKPSKANN